MWKQSKKLWRLQEKDMDSHSILWITLEKNVREYAIDILYIDRAPERKNCGRFFSCCHYCFCAPICSVVCLFVYLMWNSWNLFSAFHSISAWSMYSLSMEYAPSANLIFSLFASVFTLSPFLPRICSTHTCACVLKRGNICIYREREWVHNRNFRVLVMA